MTPTGDLMTLLRVIGGEGVRSNEMLLMERYIYNINILRTSSCGVKRKGLHAKEGWKVLKVEAKKNNMIMSHTKHNNTVGCEFTQSKIVYHLYIYTLIWSQFKFFFLLCRLSAWTIWLDAYLSFSCKPRVCSLLSDFARHFLFISHEYFCVYK